MNKILYFSIALTLVGCGKSVDITDKNPAPYVCPTPCPINGPLTPGGDVSEQYDYTQDGTKVVYIADEEQDGVNDLYVANIDGTNRKKLNLPLGINQDVARFKIAPNSQKVAYLADETVNDRLDLYTVNLDGTQHVRVNSGVPSVNHAVSDTFQWMPSSSKLVYVSDEAYAVGQRGLYIVDANGSNRVELSTFYVDPVFAIAPNGSRIVFKQTTTGNNPVAKSILPSGTGEVLLNTPFNLALEPASAVSGFVISPNSQKVVYRSNHDDDTKFELFSVNIDGSGARTKMNGVLPTGGNVGTSPNVEFMVSSDSSKVIYIADETTNNVEELYVSNIAGGGQLKLNSSLVTGGDIKKIKQAGSKVVFSVDKNIDNVIELYSVNLDGTGEVRINSALIAGENVQQFEVSADNLKVVYSMDEGMSGFYNLFSNNLSGTNEIMVNASLSGLATGVYDAAYPNAQQFKITPNSSRVVYRGSITNADFSLYSVNMDGSDEKLVHPMTSGENIEINTNAFGTSFLILPDSTKAVYRFSNSSGINLYSGSL